MGSASSIAPGGTLRSSDAKGAVTAGDHVTAAQAPIAKPRSKELSSVDRRSVVSRRRARWSALLAVTSVALLGGVSSVSCERAGPSKGAGDNVVTVGHVGGEEAETQGVGHSPTLLPNPGDPDANGPRGPYGGTNLTQCLSGLPAPC